VDGNSASTREQRIHIATEVRFKNRQVPLRAKDFESGLAHCNRRPMVSCIPDDHSGSEGYVIGTIGPLFATSMDGVSPSTINSLQGVPFSCERIEQVLVQIVDNGLAIHAPNAQDFGLLRPSGFKQRWVHHTHTPIGQRKHGVQVHRTSLLGHLDHQDPVDPLVQQFRRKANDHRPAGALRRSDCDQALGYHQYIAALNGQRCRTSRFMNPSRAPGDARLTKHWMAFKHSPRKHGLSAPGHLVGIANHDGLTHNRRQVPGKDEVWGRLKEMLTFETAPFGPHDHGRCKRCWIQGLKARDLRSTQALVGCDVLQKAGAAFWIRCDIAQQPLEGHHVRDRAQHIAQLLVFIGSRSHVNQIVKQQIVRARWLDVFWKHALHRCPRPMHNNLPQTPYLADYMNHGPGLTQQVR